LKSRGLAGVNISIFTRVATLLALDNAAKKLLLIEWLWADNPFHAQLEIQRFH